MQIIDDWLEDWLLKPSLSLEALDGPGDIVGILALRLAQDAAAEGYDAETLADACGGDLSAYLSTQMAFAATPSIIAAPTPHESMTPAVL